MAASVRANALLCWAFSNSRSIPVIRLAHCTRWLDAFVAGRLLIAGYVVLLTGLFWVNDTSSYTKLYYALLAAPTLIVMLAKPQYWRMLIREPIVMAFLVMAAWLLLSLSWTQTEDDPSSLAKRPLYVFMMFAACAIIELKDQQRLLKALRIAAMLASAAAMAGLAIFLSRNDGGRMIGTSAAAVTLLVAGLMPYESAPLKFSTAAAIVGTTICLIEHDMGVVMDLSDRVVVMDYGKKIGDGTPDEVRANPEVIAAYLGVAHE